MAQLNCRQCGGTMKKTIRKLTIALIAIAAITACGQSDRRKAIDSFRNPINTRITMEQFRTRCMSQCTSAYSVVSGTILQTSRNIMTDSGPSTTPAPIVPPPTEYKVIQLIDDFAYLANPPALGIPTTITKIPGLTEGQIISLRLYDTGVRHTASFKIGTLKKDLTLSMCILWEAVIPTHAELERAFSNGTAFEVVIPAGPEKLPTLYRVSIK